MYTHPMVTLIFESHGTTVDNEAHVASGVNDAALSALGEKQAKELGARYEGKLPDVVFCSTLQRSYRTAELAFGDKIKIIRDARLNECDYGDFNGAPEEQVKYQKPNRIEQPFPGGESYAQTTERIRSFLADLKKNYDGKTILIIGHRATQYGLEHLLNAVPLLTVVTAPWKWQPGWAYVSRLSPPPAPRDS